MSPVFTKTWFAVCFGLAVSLATAPAVTLTLSPESMSTDFSGRLGVQIQGGLTTGETVLLERFLDLNGNGTADPNEPLTLRVRLTDGQASVIGGVTNINAAHDLNPAEAQIGTEFLVGELERFGGKYLFRVSSPTERFAPATAVLTVTNAGPGQSISGVVRSGGTNLPQAWVGLLRTGPDDELVGGVIADDSGRFTITAPPGLYELLAIKNGYVFGEGLEVNLAAGATVTQDVQMTVATRVVSGKLVDAENPEIALGGVPLFLESMDEFTVGFTDANGNFSLPVTAGHWEMEVSETALALLGYVAVQEEVDTSSGDVTGLEPAISKATALVYGYLKGSDNQPLSGINIYSDSNNLRASGSGTDEAGYYVIGVGPGTWWVSPAQEELASQGYLVSSTNVSLSAGQAMRVDFQAARFTAYLSGRVVDQDGDPVGNIWISANDWSDGWSGVETDGNGEFRLGLFAGTWHLQLSSEDAAERGLLSPSLSFEVSDGMNLTGIAFVAQRTSAFIAGSVRDAEEAPISFVGVWASANVAGTNYNTYVETDGSGNFSLGVINGTWMVGMSSEDLSQRGFATPESQTRSVLNGNQTVNFTVEPMMPLEITSDWLPEGTVGVFYSAGIGVWGGSPPYNFALAPGSDPLPPDLWFGGMGILSGTPSAAGTFNLAVQVNDWMGSSITKTVSLRINDGGSPEFRFVEIKRTSNGEMEMHLSGQEGKSYQLEASPSLSNPIWESVESASAGVGGAVYLRDRYASAFNTRFYRVVLLNDNP